MKLEAEDAAVPTGCSVAMMPRLGYSGTGYLSGLDAKNQNSLVLDADIPATQHYDITVVVGASAASTCKILVNGESVYTMKQMPRIIYACQDTGHLPTAPAL